MRRTRMRMNRLAASGHAAPREMFRRISPGHVRLFPRHADHFGRDALTVDHRLRAEVADPSLDIEMAVRLDDEQAVEASRPADESADGDTDATNLTAHTLAAVRLTNVPAEFEGAFVECLLQETARRV